ncbi:MAG: FHA domain-containing protein [Planctomycetes bacterium]|nr:FHA domain-containing protein [Planctomycetota bacterium]
MNVTLVGFTKKGVRKDIRVQGASAVIGRTPDADIQIPVADVSRKHCQIAVAGNKVSLKDLNSSNGTFVNSQKVSETTLRPGDRLTVGPFTFVVQIDGQPKDIKTVPSKPAAPAAPQAATKMAAPPAPKMPAEESEFDLDDMSDVDLDDMSPIGDLDELEEIDPDELEEISGSDLLDEDEQPKGKK